MTRYYTASLMEMSGLNNVNGTRVRLFHSSDSYVERKDMAYKHPDIRKCSGCPKNMHKRYMVEVFGVWFCGACSTIQCVRCRNKHLWEERVNMICLGGDGEEWKKEYICQDIEQCTQRETNRNMRLLRRSGMLKSW